MKTPILTKNQQKTALSARKLKKETIKNVIVSPYAKYWPVLSHEDNSIILTVLQSNLPRLKHEKVNVPWTELSTLSKSERKQARASYLSKTSVKMPLNTSERSKIIFGINDVTEGLEQNCVASILITSDVLPKLLVKHVIDMAVLKKVPVLLVKDLRKTLKTRCGISSIAVAFKNAIQPNTQLNLIHQEIKHVYESYPVPKKHMNYSEMTKNDIVIQEDKQENIIEPENIEKNILLIRKNSAERVFVPEMSKKEENITMQMESTSFIEFCKEKVTRTENKQHNSLKKYKSLLIKRLKGDSNRNTRKIEQQKRKKHQ